VLLGTLPEFCRRMTMIDNGEIVCDAEPLRAVEEFRGRTWRRTVPKAICLTSHASTRGAYLSGFAQDAPLLCLYPGCWALRVLPAQAPELLRPRAAHRHARPVEQLRLEIPAGVRLERPHLLEVHDVRPMHAHEAARVETSLETAQREMEHVPTVRGMSDHVVAVGLEP
jgi:hypothetical protein